MVLWLLLVHDAVACEHHEMKFKDEIPYNTKDDTQSITAQEQVQTRSMQVTVCKRYRDLQLVAGAFTGRHPDLRLRFDKSNGSAIIEAHPRPGLARFSVDKDTCMCLIVDPLKFLT